MKNRKNLLRTISYFLLIAAIIALNFPLVSNLFKTEETEKMYSEYIETIEKEIDCPEVIEEINEYNRTLLGNENRFMSEKTNETYYKTINIQEGIMAYISVPSAGVISLPVFHYATTETLQVGAGHIAGSSLPATEKGVHTAISAHSGMSGMKGFSQLSSVKEGDEFTVSYLNKTLTYRVINITTVLPDDMEPLEIDPVKNLCSLVTCTPIGFNTHRLIVTGEFIKETIATDTIIRNEVTETKVQKFAAYELVMSGISIFLIAILVKDFVKARRNKKKILAKGQENKEFTNEFENELLTPDEALNEGLEFGYQDGGIESVFREIY